MPTAKPTNGWRAYRRYEFCPHATLRNDVRSDLLIGRSDKMGCPLGGATVAKLGRDARMDAVADRRHMFGERSFEDGALS